MSVYTWSLALHVNLHMFLGWLGSVSLPGHKRRLYRLRLPSFLRFSLGIDALQLPWAMPPC
jgi:hypothetical protein